MKTKTQKIVTAALFAALCCVATMIIKIPSPLKGYLNLGDCIVLLSGWLISPFYAFMAAGIGSALADVFSGYFIYAPITFLIKGLMAIIAYFSWLVLIPIFAAPQSRFARYHANQGLVLAIMECVWWAISSVLSIALGSISILLGSIIGSVCNIVSLVFFVLQVWGIVNAANGKAQELPVIGSIKILK